MGLLIVAVGCFSAGCGVFDWEWAMTNRQGRLLSKLITRTGARVVCVVAGGGMIVFGILMTTGVIATT